MAEIKSLDDVIRSGVEKALNNHILEGKSVLEWAKIGMDLDRVKVVRCMDCRFWEPENAEEGDSYGRCRNDYAPCQNQQTDMNWFCADGEWDG